MNTAIRLTGSMANLQAAQAIGAAKASTDIRSLLEGEW